MSRKTHREHNPYGPHSSGGSFALDEAPEPEPQDNPPPPTIPPGGDEGE